MEDSYFNYICCPYCKEDLTNNGDFLFCKKCNLNFEIKNGIPILINKNLLNEHLLQQIEYFNKETEDRGEYELEEWQKSYISRFNNNFSDIKDKLILDCGTGSGYMCIELAKKGAIVIACDLTYNNLYNLKSVAKKLNFSDRIMFVCCSAEDLPFKSNIFDYIILNAILEHLYRENDAILNIDRVCKKVDAGLMVTVPLSYKYINPIFLPINFFHDKRIGHLRRYNKEILVDKFMNFKLLNVYYTGHFGKVFKTLVNKFFKLYNDREIELEDYNFESKKLFASNIIVFLIRK